MAEYSTSEALYTVLDATVAKMQEHEKFMSRIANANMSMTFVVTDLGAEYSMYFDHGAFRGEKGGGTSTTVGITLTSTTLDKLLSGKLSGESAYMSGALRLRGDEWTAQSAAGYLWYIKSAYTEAAEAA